MTRNEIGPVRTLIDRDLRAAMYRHVEASTRCALTAHVPGFKAGNRMVVIGAPNGSSELILVMQINHKENMRKAKIGFFAAMRAQSVSFMDFGNWRSRHVSRKV